MASRVAFHGEYREIVEDERIVTTEVFEGMPGAEAAVNVITFTENDGITTLTLLMQLVDKETRDMILSTGMESGIQEQMLLLEQVVSQG